jgi:hypothetical protein
VPWRSGLRRAGTRSFPAIPSALIRRADPESLEGNTRRAIDIHEGEEIDEAAFTALVRAAVSANRA